MKKAGTILLIDDDPDDNFFHTRIIKISDAAEKVDVVRNGEEALNYLNKSENGPDLILLDLNMPKMDGWEFLEEYKKLPPQRKGKKLFILSTSNFPEDIERAEETKEVQGYLIKPLTQEMLGDILK